MYGMGEDDDDESSDGDEALEGGIPGSDDEDEEDEDEDHEMEFGEEESEREGSEGLDDAMDADGSVEGNFRQREAIERLKDDLFADEEDQDVSGNLFLRHHLRPLTIS